MAYSSLAILDIKSFFTDDSANIVSNLGLWVLEDDKLMKDINTKILESKVHDKDTDSFPKIVVKVD